MPRLQTIREAAFCPVFQSFRGLTGAAIASLAFAAANEEQAALLERLCRPDPGQLVFVAERASEIVGFVCVSLNRESLIGEIGLNAVDPSHAGKGIGTQLYEFALRLMREQSMRLATVGTGGDASHTPARRAYAKAGFGPAIPSLTLYKLL